VRQAEPASGRMKHTATLGRKVTCKVVTKTTPCKLAPSWLVQVGNSITLAGECCSRHLANLCEDLMPHTTHGKLTVTLLRK
jgi:hypothetical protein